MQPTAYVFFHGNCAEAMQRYAEIFGSPPPEMFRFSDMPDEAKAQMPAVPADFDDDCDVDLNDVDAFEACASGSAIPVVAGCGGKDLDHDGDADQAVFSLVQGCFSGSGQPGDPACAD